VPPNFSQLGAIAARVGVPQGEIDAIREKHAKIRQAIEAGPRLLARLQDFGCRSDWSGAAAYADANDVLGVAATASQKEPEGANALYFFLSTLFHETGRCSDELDVLTRREPILIKLLQDHKRPPHISPDKPEFSLSLLYSMIGDACVRMGQYAKGIDAFKQGLKRINVDGDSFALQASLQANIGTAYSRMGNADEAAEVLTEAMRLAEQNNDSSGLIQATYNKALNCQRLGLLTECVTHLHNFLKLPISAHQQCEAHLSLAHVYRVQSRFQEAWAALFCAAPFADRSGDLSLQARAFEGMGAVASAMNNDVLAVKNYARSMEIWETLQPDGPELSLICGNSGASLVHLGRYEEATKMYNKSIQLCGDRELEFRRTQYLNLGLCVVRQMQGGAVDTALMAQALTYFKTCLSLGDHTQAQSAGQSRITRSAGPDNARMLALLHVAQLTYDEGNGAAEDEAVAFLRQLLQLAVVGVGRNMCHDCGQVRADGVPMTTCSDCKVSRYCNQEHQRREWSMTNGHKRLCPLLKRWRQVTKGKDTPEACLLLHKSFLQQGRSRLLEGRYLGARVLSVGARAKIHSLLTSPQHNGVIGELVAFSKEKGRWQVKLPETASTPRDADSLWIKPANLALSD